MKLLGLMLTLSTFHLCYSYHILCLHHMPSIGHHYLATGIVKPLLKASHKVTWVSLFPNETPNHQNLTVIDVSNILAEVGSLNKKLRLASNILLMREINWNISQATLRNEQLRLALVNNQYDAVISAWSFSDSDAGYAAIQQVPWILFSSVTMHPYHEHLVDTIRTVPTHPIFLNYPIPMTLYQRVITSFLYAALMFDIWIGHSSNRELYESSFEPLATARGITLPPYSSALHNISILFVNSHPSFSPVRSLPPNVVEIGGFHIDDEVPELPEDLQRILDSSPQGAILFSMGSLLKCSSWREPTKKALIKMFGKLPYTVLWKYEEEIYNIPKNIHVRKWMPQSSILAHPNLKAFITHAGLLSTLEALHHGVPLLVIPVFGDQHLNADSSVRAGKAIKVKFRPDMAPNIGKGVKTLLQNDSYSLRAKSLSKLFKNRPVPPSKLITHYVELAIETKGAFHLRSEAQLYDWYELFMLDQLVVFFAIYLIVKYVMKLLKFLIESLFCSGNKLKIN